RRPWASTPKRYARRCSGPIRFLPRPMAADRPLYAEIADPGSLARFGEEIEAANPSDWPGYPGQIRRARAATGARHAVTTGAPTVGCQPCGPAGLHFTVPRGWRGT